MPPPRYRGAGGNDGAKIQLWDNHKNTFYKPKPKAPAE
jgi:hypothetical protein